MRDNYNVNNSYAYNSNLAYNLPRYDEDYENRFDIRVEKSRGLSKKQPYGKLKTFGIAAFCVAILVSLLVQYVTISRTESQISKCKTEMKAVEDEIFNADVKIAETLDVNFIKKIAVGKLGMVEPTDSQLMYISVPNEDYTVNY